ncbi:MAG: thioredoxin domain-containing protein [Verrucomicrobiota bacterium]
MNPEVKDSVNNSNSENRLTNSNSPYLLQHADDPVDWFPWCPEAFEEAGRKDKPIFLSIGYSSCHWCHVMQRESFKKPEVAALMNEVFVSIKVDREERPDIDNLYMPACQAMTGSGGWPLSIVMTPDKKPFFAATYLPSHGRFQRPGMIELCERIRELWNVKREDLQESASRAMELLHDSGPEPGESPSPEDFDRLYESFLRQFDDQYGGFGSAPKFPMPHSFMYLLRYWKRTGKDKALNMVEQSLQAMARSGIFDHLGFGFHRYSTDRQWKIPHFEKMLYDQALLLIAYVETHLATGNPIYAETARSICEYVLRDLTSPEGGFYSSENAESEGVEGKFYVWSSDEIDRALTSDQRNIATAVYDIRKTGNFENSGEQELAEKNILHMTGTIEELSQRLDISPEKLKNQIKNIRQTLVSERNKRTQPSLDNKILTDWNGLMIAALAKAGQALSEPRYVEAANKAADFILANMFDGSVLLHRYRNGKAGIYAHADDYAFFVWGLLELYQSDFDTRRLAAAKKIQDKMIGGFRDSNLGGFFFTGDYIEDLPARRKETYDGAVPAANSIAMLNLLRLARMTAQSDYEKIADETARNAALAIKKVPSGFAMLMCALDFGIGPSCEVVIVEDGDATGADKLLEALRSVFSPNKIVLLRRPDQDPPLAKLAPFTREQTSIKGKATAYICRHYKCEQPTTDPKRAIQLLDAK